MTAENNAASAEQEAATKSIWLRGFIAPIAIGIVTIIIGANGRPFPALAFLAVAGTLLVAFHLIHITKLYRWASGALDRAVPRGVGPWEPALYALHRRLRVRPGQQHDLSSALADLRNASEALPDGMVILDADHRVEWSNRQATAHLGVRVPDDSGRPVVNLVRQPQFAVFLAAGELADRLQMASARDPGVVLSLQIIPYAGGRKLLISRDITRFERAETMRRDFIANVSHELRTPLTVLIGYLEMLRGQTLDAAASKSAVESMNTQAQAMQRLVEDLLTLSALESPQNPLREEPITTAPLLERVRA
ncbi:MAG: DUF3329 domain-containing protein, partial [Burkholderiales bacterium]|nr:DUF3329 domain-containing protein [Burkholderiales bacterium]